jgi:hypothetical protein
LDEVYEIHSKLIEKFIQFINNYDCFNSINFYFNPINIKSQLNYILKIYKTNYKQISALNSNNYNIYNTHQCINSLFIHIIIYDYNRYNNMNELEDEYQLCLFYKISNEIFYMPIKKNLRFCWISSIVRSNIIKI